MAEIIVLAEHRKKRELARRTDELTLQLDGMVLMLALLALWLTLGAVLADASRRMCQ